MGIMDILLGKKPPPPEIDSAPVERSLHETLPRSQRKVGRSLSDFFGILRGTSSGHVKVCPSCNRSMDPEETHCPVGHYVG